MGLLAIHSACSGRRHSQGQRFGASYGYRITADACMWKLTGLSRVFLLTCALSTTFFDTRIPHATLIQGSEHPGNAHRKPAKMSPRGDKATALLTGGSRGSSRVAASPAVVGFSWGRVTEDILADLEAVHQALGGPPTPRTLPQRLHPTSLLELFFAEAEQHKAKEPAQRKAFAAGPLHSPTSALGGEGSGVSPRLPASTATTKTSPWEVLLRAPGSASGTLASFPSRDSSGNVGAPERVGRFPPASSPVHTETRYFPFISHSRGPATDFTLSSRITADPTWAPVPLPASKSDDANIYDTKRTPPPSRALLHDSQHLPWRHQGGSWREARGSRQGSRHVARGGAEEGQEIKGRQDGKISAESGWAPVLHPSSKSARAGFYDPKRSPSRGSALTDNFQRSLWQHQGSSWRERHSSHPGSRDAAEGGAEEGQGVKDREGGESFVSRIWTAVPYRGPNAENAESGDWQRSPQPENALSSNLQKWLGRHRAGSWREADRSRSGSSGAGEGEAEEAQGPKGRKEGFLVLQGAHVHESSGSSGRPRRYDARDERSFPGEHYRGSLLDDDTETSLVTPTRSVHAHGASLTAAEFLWSGRSLVNLAGVFTRSPESFQTAAPRPQLAGLAQRSHARGSVDHLSSSPLQRRPPLLPTPPRRLPSRQQRSTHKPAVHSNTAATHYPPADYRVPLAHIQREGQLEWQPPQQPRQEDWRGPMRQQLMQQQQREQLGQQNEALKPRPVQHQRQLEQQRQVEPYHLRIQQQQQQELQHRPREGQPQQRQADLEEVQWLGQQQHEEQRLQPLGRQQRLHQQPQEQPPEQQRTQQQQEHQRIQQQRGLEQQRVQHQKDELRWIQQQQQAQQQHAKLLQQLIQRLREQQGTQQRRMLQQQQPITQKQHPVPEQRRQPERQLQPGMQQQTRQQQPEQQQQLEQAGVEQHQQQVQLTQQRPSHHESDRQEQRQLEEQQQQAVQQEQQAVQQQEQQPEWVERPQQLKWQQPKWHQQPREQQEPVEQEQQQQHVVSGVGPAYALSGEPSRQQEAEGDAAAWPLHGVAGRQRGRAEKSASPGGDTSSRLVHPPLPRRSACATAAPVKGAAPVNPTTREGTTVCVGQEDAALERNGRHKKGDSARHASRDILKGEGTRRGGNEDMTARRPGDTGDSSRNFSGEISPHGWPRPQLPYEEMSSPSQLGDDCVPRERECTRVSTRTALKSVESDDECCTEPALFVKWKAPRMKARKESTKERRSTEPRTKKRQGLKLRLSKHEATSANTESGSSSDTASHVVEKGARGVKIVGGRRAALKRRKPPPDLYSSVTMLRFCLTLLVFLLIAAFLSRYV